MPSMPQSANLHYGGRRSMQDCAAQIVGRYLRIPRIFCNHVSVLIGIEDNKTAGYFHAARRTG